MAGTLKTDLIAVRDALVSADQVGAGGLTVGVDPFALIDAMIKRVDDDLRICNEINRTLPSGSAKTAMAAVLTDLT